MHQILILVSVWELKFHPTCPDHLFTCSEDGCVWHWDGSQVNATPMGLGPGASHLTGTGMLYLSPTTRAPFLPREIVHEGDGAWRNMTFLTKASSSTASYLAVSHLENILPIRLSSVKENLVCNSVRAIAER